MDAKVRFFDKYNTLQKEFTGTDIITGSYVTETLNSDIILYVDVKDEGSVTLTFEMADNNLSKFFPYQYDDGAEIVNYVRKLNPGRYRIILPTTRNEDLIKINFSVKGEVDFYVVPNYFQY